MPVSDELRRLVEAQCGLATRRQLFTHGMTPDEVRSRLGRHWRVVLPGVVLLAWP